jgi:hypothetical protein
VGVPEIIVVAFFMVWLGCHKMLSEGLQSFKDALGGGPQPPTHPLPGDDSGILNRRRSRLWPEL